MKTAVDWLVDHLYLVIPNEERNFLEGLRKEALDKEKNQIEIAFDLGRDEVTSIFLIDGEDYYNKSYNQNK